MFNVFPFENTINIMYLSGSEMQEMFDFVAERSAEPRLPEPGAGLRRALHHGLRPGAAQRPAHRLRPQPTGEQRQRLPRRTTARAAPPGSACDDVATGGRCWAHPAIDIEINGKPLDPNGTYRVAVNDYIAKGGSGFAVLKRNTTRIETGISLRDSLIGYMQGFCTCDDILAGARTTDGNVIGKNGPALRQPDSRRQVGGDDQVLSYCSRPRPSRTRSTRPLGQLHLRRRASRQGRRRPASGGDFDAEIAGCQCDCCPRARTSAAASCRDALAGDPLCGTSPRSSRPSVRTPPRCPIAIGAEDGRIGRRVK